MGDATSHARHDRFAVAAAVGGETVPATVRTCPACGALYADLLDLRHAIRHAWAPSRPRDHRLHADDGARLRPAGWRGLIPAFGTRRDAISRPIGIGFATLGLVGILLGSVPVVSLGSSAAGPAAEVAGGAPVMSAPSAAPIGVPGVAFVEPPIDVTKGPARADAAQADRLHDRSTGVIWLSIGFLVLGIGLLGLRRSVARGAMR